jgi:hypothetical protein
MALIGISITQPFNPCVDTTGQYLAEPYNVVVTPEFTTTAISVTIQYDLYLGNTLVQTDTFTGPPTPVSAFVMDYPSPATGVYLLIVSYADGLNSTSRSYTFTVLENWLIIPSTTAAHAFTVCNASPTNDIEFTVTDFEGNELSGYVDIPVLQGEESIVTLPSDGVYVVNFYDTTTSAELGNKIVVDYSDLNLCLINTLQKVLCNTDDECTNYCKDKYYLDRIIPLATLFFAKANTEIQLNHIYPTITTEKYAQLQTIQNILNKLNTYCDTCGSNTNTTNNSMSVGDCGCGCGGNC